VIAVAGELGFRVVAEGVETPAQAAELEALGCHAYHDYLYSAAVSRSEAAALLMRHAATTPHGIPLPRRSTPPPLPVLNS